LERAEILQQVRDGGEELTQSLSEYEQTVCRDKIYKNEFGTKHVDL
jgi:hypothetical protein